MLPTITVWGERDTHVRAEGTTRAFFLVYGTDIESMEESMRA